MTQGGEPCARCGAPRVPGFAACKYCKAIFETDPDRPAVPCPRCATLSEWGTQKCVACQAWIVVACVFCRALSPHNAPACLKCSEVFAGAPDRLRQRQEQASRHQTMQVVGQVGSVAATFLGAAAGAAVGGSWGSSGGFQRNGDGYAHGHDHQRSDYGRDDGYRGRGGESYGQNQGGGIMDQLFDSSSSGGGASSDYGSTDSGQANDQPGGSGGGILSELFGGSSDSSSSSSNDSGGGGILDELMGDSGSSSDDS